MKEVVDLLALVLGFGWLFLAGYIVFRFGAGIDRILKSVQKGKFFGQEFELGEQLDDLEERAQESASSLTDTGPTLQLSPHSFDDEAVDDSEDLFGEVDEVLDTAKKNPKVALMMLANAIEQELREIFFSQGIISRPKKFSWINAIDDLTRTHLLSNPTGVALNAFRRVRHFIVHSIVHVPDSEILRAIDSGITILTTLKDIPRGRYFVRYADLPVFSDPDCTQNNSGVRGLMIESEAGGERMVVGVYPTLQDHYVGGKQVAWEWKGGTIYARNYYIDPETGEKKEAWGESFEFVGRNLEDT